MIEPKNTSEYYELLIYSYLSNNISDDECNILYKWLEESEENKKKLGEIKKVIDLSELSESERKFDHDKIKALELILEKLEINEENQEVTLQNSKKEDRRHSYWKITRIAASFLIFFSIGALASWWIASRNFEQIINSEFVHEVYVPQGNKSQVTLPDGTKVWLNAGTHFRYMADYGVKNRNVYLEGEAFFHVKTNRAMPFIVHTSELKIKAFGTSFNVKAYTEEKYISTTLEEGILKIEGKGVDLSLNPKQNITYYKKELTKSDASPEVNTADAKAPTINQSSNTINANNIPKIKISSNINTQIYTSWKDNEMIIESEDLATISVLLERKYNVSIHIESKELLDYKFIGVFQKETLEQVLNVLRLSAPLKYKIENGVVTIDFDKKRKANYQEVLTKGSN
jgi:transmembrane sensor